MWFLAIQMRNAPMDLKKMSDSGESSLKEPGGKTSRKVPSFIRNPAVHLPRMRSVQTYLKTPVPPKYQ